LIRSFVIGTFGITRHVRIPSVFLVAVVTLILGTAAPEVLAQPPSELEAKIILETYYTDEDTGIQVCTDGDPWKIIMIFYPNGDPLHYVSRPEVTP
jgi:hypothetical protein